MDINKLKYQREQINTYGHLLEAARWALSCAAPQHEAPEDFNAGNVAYYSSMHTILASVFFLEAYMNHVGPRFFGDKWDNNPTNWPPGDLQQEAHRQPKRWEKKGLRKTKDKLKGLIEELKLDIRCENPEYLSFILAMQIRDQLVHGRTYEICDPKLSRIKGNRVVEVHPEWEKHCNPEMARQIFAAAESIADKIAKACGEERVCYQQLGNGSGWVSSE
ncbi:MAG: hypothetical protein PF904_13800 [Kiritimatiellae bacterium]|nr:hypothetical protein [Kiritimatiellia bacterium]